MSACRGQRATSVPGVYARVDGRFYTRVPQSCGYSKRPSTLGSFDTMADAVHALNKYTSDIQRQQRAAVTPTPPKRKRSPKTATPVANVITPTRRGEHLPHSMKAQTTTTRIVIGSFGAVTNKGCVPEETTGVIFSAPDCAKMLFTDDWPVDPTVRFDSDFQFPLDDVERELWDVLAGHSLDPFVFL